MRTDIPFNLRGDRLAAKLGALGFGSGKAFPDLVTMRRMIHLERLIHIRGKANPSFAPMMPAIVARAAKRDGIVEMIITTIGKRYHVVAYQVIKGAAPFTATVSLECLSYNTLITQRTPFR